MSVKCDFCYRKEAKYDGRTCLGCWANMCEDCFPKVGKGLGLGKGQKLAANAYYHGNEWKVKEDP